MYILFLNCIQYSNTFLLEYSNFFLATFIVHIKCVQFYQVWTKDGILLKFIKPTWNHFHGSKWWRDTQKLPFDHQKQKKKIKLIASTCCMRKVENIERFARRRRLFFSSSFYWSMAYKRIIHCHKKSLSGKKNCLWRAKNETINNVSYANISVFFSFNSFCNCCMKFKFVLCGKRNVVLFLRIDFFCFHFWYR